MAPYPDRRTGTEPSGKVDIRSPVVGDSSVMTGLVGHHHLI
jgi:hypothetical protein